MIFDGLSTGASSFTFSSGTIQGLFLTDSALLLCGTDPLHRFPCCLQRLVTTFEEGDCLRRDHQTRLFPADASHLFRAVSMAS